MGGRRWEDVARQCGNRRKNVEQRSGHTFIKCFFNSLSAVNHLIADTAPCWWTCFIMNITAASGRCCPSLCSSPEQSRGNWWRFFPLIGLTGFRTSWFSTCEQNKGRPSTPAWLQRRSQGPGSRVQSPKSRVQGPGSRVQSPGSRALRTCFSLLLTGSQQRCCLPDWSNLRRC